MFTKKVISVFNTIIMNLKKPMFYIIAIAVVILAVIIVGLITNPLNDSPWLTKNEIVNTFEAHDLALEKDNSKTPFNYAIRGIEPDIFQFKKYDGILYIYIFDDLDKNSNKYTISPFYEFNEMEFDGAITTYNSKNAIIILEAPFGKGDILDTNEYTQFSKLSTLISDTVFLYLNDGETVIYNGQSEHWSGTSTVKYYNNPITDENDILHMDTDGWTTSQLKYIGNDLENIEDIAYKSNSSSGYGLRINDCGIVNLGGDNSGSNLPLEVEIIVMWNGQEERLVLQP